MQLIGQVGKKTLHYVQNYDLLNNITTRMSLYNVYDVIFRHMETQHLMSVEGNSVTH